MPNRSIAEQNDAFRSNPFQSDLPGKLLFTNGVQALGKEIAREIFEKVKAFNDFTSENDPYGEHDFGSIVHEERKFFWKFDYFDPTLQFHSEDKSDPSKTMRVLTIMLASEY